MQALKLAPISLKDYLAIEQQDDKRYEFHDGYIYAMAGGTLNHGRISGNIYRKVGNSLEQRNASCEPFNSDTKLYIERGKRFVYPDMMVVCGKAEVSSVYKEAVTNPSLIVEVLSESTESYDRGDKFFFYQNIASLKQYVLISQEKVQIEVWTRGEGNSWKIDRETDLSSTVVLDSIDVTLDVAQLYLNVDFNKE
jgi:Uma2 family endonuclease